MLIHRSFIVIYIVLLVTQYTTANRERIFIMSLYENQCSWFLVQKILLSWMVPTAVFVLFHSVNDRQYCWLIIEAHKSEYTLQFVFAVINQPLPVCWNWGKFVELDRERMTLFIYMHELDGPYYKRILLLYIEKRMRRSKL